MKKMLDLLSAEVAKAFAEAGYDEKYARVSLSNRPDLCEYQCNGAMAGAKLYKKAPIMIANDVVEQLKDNKLFDSIEAVMPGFINIKLSADYIDEYVSNMNDDERLGKERTYYSYSRLRRSECCKASSCWTFTSGNYWRKCKENLQICGRYCIW